MLDEVKFKAQSIKIAMQFQLKDEKILNNILNDMKVKYKIEDEDWIQISVAFSTLTSREVISKLGGK